MSEAMPLADNGIIEHRDVMVEMRDGVHLRTDVFHPAGGAHTRRWFTATPTPRTTA
jgi:hypothetical protein